MSSNPSLDRLTDQALLAQFGDLVQRDQHGTASLLRHIEAIDRRQLWAKYGHPSLFDFCVSRFHMSESTAGKRIGAARAARRFPLLFEMVARGEIHLSTIHRIKAHLTPENHERVLAQAKHKTIRQLEGLVAQLAPRPDVPSTLRALPAWHETATSALASPTPTTTATPSPTPPRRAPDPEPLAPGRYKLAMTLDESTYQKLKQIQDLLAHGIPNGDPAAIIGRALDVLLSQLLHHKAGITDKPRARRSITARRVRWIPAAVRREVWRRDQGRCSFVGADGHRCNDTRGVEFAHVVPWAKGGGHSASNICLRCIAHNAWEAQRDYGARFMAKKRGKPWSVREPVATYVARQASTHREPNRSGCESRSLRPFSNRDNAHITYYHLDRVSRVEYDSLSEQTANQKLK